MITSMANGHIKQLRLLMEKSRARNREGVFLAEGIKMFTEAPASGIREIYYAESFDLKALPEVREKLMECEKKGALVEMVSDEVLKKTADTKTPQGILFVMEQMQYAMNEMVDRAVRRYREGGREPLFLLLEDIQDPGNLGTMLRTGEGAGVDGVIMSRGTVDIYNPKTIRSTMGSLYRVPFVYVEELSEAIDLLQKNDISVYAAHLKGQRFFDEQSYEGGSAFLIGNEGNGLKKETADLADTYLKIPMEGKLESLNAAVAAALLLYQASGNSRRKQLK